MLQDEVLIAGFGRRGHAVGDIPGVRFKVWSPAYHVLGSSSLRCRTQASVASGKLAACCITQCTTNGSLLFCTL